jgi:hypothetical protein
MRQSIRRKMMWIITLNESESTVCDVHTTTIVDECVLTLTQRDDAEWCPRVAALDGGGVAELSTSTAVAEERVDFEACHQNRKLSKTR